MKRSRPPVLAQQNFQKHRQDLERLGLGERFREIYRKNIWGSPETVSGVGSTLDATAPIREGLLEICRRYGIKSMLDAPCGDYGWMSTSQLPIERYTGLDIVPDLIERNKSAYENSSTSFIVADLTTDTLPKADIILCRDCLVHLSFQNIARVVSNFAASRSTYLLTTTFPDHDRNEDIQDGDWRLLNLRAAPFNFPEPLHLINERCAEIEGAYDDKSLGLWRIDDLPR